MSSTPRHTVEAEKFNLAVTISLNFMLNQIIHLQSIGKKKIKNGYTTHFRHNNKSRFIIMQHHDG